MAEIDKLITAIFGESKRPKDYLGEQVKITFTSGVEISGKLVKSDDGIYLLLGNDVYIVHNKIYGKIDKIEKIV